MSSDRAAGEEAWLAYSERCGGKLIHHTEDEWGAILVTAHKRYRVLTFDTLYEQSTIDLKRPAYLVHEYTRTMMLGLLMTEPSRVLLLGLGGGCLARSLVSLLPTVRIQAVELREKVVEVARDYFGLPGEDNLTVVIDDARHWLKGAEPACVDLVFADLYEANGISACQNEVRFVRHVDRVLTAQGCLVANFHHVPPFNSPFFEALSRAFASLFLCSVASGNTILFAIKADFQYDIRTLLSGPAERLGDAVGAYLLPALARFLRVDLG